MRRVLSLHFPWWATDVTRRRMALRSRAERLRPLLLIEAQAGREVVASCCGRAWVAGVRPGVTLAQARAILCHTGEPLLQPHEPERLAAALEALARWAIRVSPVSSPAWPDGLHIDVSGTALLYRGEARLARSVVRAIQRHGITARAAIASTPGCGMALARACDRSIVLVEPGQEAAALAPISIAALRLDAECVRRLDAVGVETIADLMALGREGLPARFGPEPLARLDGALGQAFEVLEPVRPKPQPSVERVFEGPTISAMGIAIASREVVAQLAGVLEAQGVGAMTLVLALDRIDAEPVEIMVRLSRPSRDGQHLWRLLAPRVERVNLGFGVEAITLTATRVGKVRHRQHLAPELRSELVPRGGGPPAQGQDEADEHEASIAALVDTLSGRLGVEGVLKMEAVRSHVPERAARLRPALPLMDLRGGRAARARRSERTEPDVAMLVPGPRPAVLLQPPEPAEVTLLVPDGPAAMLRWRGRQWPVLRTTGPERVAPEWWRARPMMGKRATRDYFVMQLASGAWIWACRESLRGAWFVHGVWA